MDIGLSSTICAPTPRGASAIASTDAGETRVPARRSAPSVAAPRVIRNTDPDPSLGRFRLLEQVGGGSFGEVWKAHDARLDRLVAIKVAHTPVADGLTPAMLEEARLAAQLRHPHIVRVHELDAHGNRVFIVSDLIDGCTLAEWRESTQPTIRQSVAMTEKIARALQHAHERGVVHRDLKPGNVMVGRDGEPCLVDFGLGMRATQNPASDSPPIIVGTPRYMSPEQAAGASQQLDCRADLYSLGVILFELLTGRRPFSGSTTELLEQLQSQDVPPPRDLNPNISRDLEQVCLKCLKRSPDDRYATAKDVADDLTRCLARRPVSARPISLVLRAARLLQRHPIVTGTLILSIVATQFSAIANRRADEARHDLTISEAYDRVLDNSQWSQALLSQARSSKYRRAVETADRRRHESPLLPARCYDLACVYALAADMADSDDKLTADERRELMHDYRTAACELLEQARDKKYFDSPDCRRHLQRDRQFDSLKNEQAFVRLMASLKDEQT